MKRQLVGAWTAVTMVTAMMGGCASKNMDTQDATQAQGVQETNLESGTVELTVWAEEDTFDTVNQMIESFQQAYAGMADFSITLEQNTDSDTRDRVLSDIHSAADVYMFADDQLSSLVAGGALYAVPNAEEVKAANLEGASEAATVDDTLYAYPMTADNGYFMFYNKKYFSEEDLETFDGMLAVAQKNDKQITMDWSSGWYLYAFFGNTGLEFGINDDNVTNYCEWNSTSGDIRGVDIAQAMLAIAANPAFCNGGDDALKSGAKDGSVIAGVSGVWCETELENIWGDDLGAVKLPTYTVAGEQVQMSSFTGYKLMGVNAYSEHPEWAAKLADWLTNEENQTIRFENQSQGPSNINASESEVVTSNPAIRAVAEQSEFGTLQRVGNSYWEACTTFGQLMADGNPGNKQLQEVMDDLVAGITKSVAE